MANQLTTIIERKLKDRYLAHVRQEKDGSFIIHDLDEHLRSVARLASDFAAVFGNPDWAAGLSQRGAS